MRELNGMIYFSNIFFKKMELRDFCLRKAVPALTFFFAAIIFSGSLIAAEAHKPLLKWKIAIEGGAAGTESYSVGGDEPLCQEFLKYMNSSIRQDVHQCISKAKLFPRFSQPAWKQLNPREHHGLISKLLQYRVEGENRYFDRTTVPERRPDAIQYYAEEARKFIEGGGGVQLLVTAPYDPSLNTIEGQARKTQNLIQLRSSNKSKCKDMQNYEGLFLVDDMLQGPDPAVTAGFDPSQTIHFFDGKRFLLKEDNSRVDVYREGDGLFRAFCSIVPAVPSK